MTGAPSKDEIALAVLWRNWYLALRKFVKYGLRYGNLSGNLNSRRYWDARLARCGSYWRDENYWHLIDLLPHSRPFTLLDVGCALGDGCELLAQKFPNASIAGADISGVGIREARRKTRNVDYCVLDILREEPSKVYDYITCIETLEHFDDPFQIVDKCLRFVNRSMIISVPFDAAGKSGRINCIGEHRHRFNRETFKAYNHTVVKITPYVEATKSSCIIYVVRNRDWPITSR